MFQGSLVPASTVRSKMKADSRSFQRSRSSAIQSRSHEFESRTGVPERGINQRFAPYALWLVRLIIGAVFLQHVMRIVFGYEPVDTSQLFGLPPGISPFAVVWEAAIGVALVYGVWPRLAAIAGAATLTVSLMAAHATAAFAPYAWRSPVFLIAALLAFALAGDGAFTLVPSRSGFHPERHS